MVSSGGRTAKSIVGSAPLQPHNKKTISTKTKALTRKMHSPDYFLMNNLCLGSKLGDRDNKKIAFPTAKQV